MVIAGFSCCYICWVRMLLGSAGVILQHGSCLVAEARNEHSIASISQ